MGSIVRPAEPGDAAALAQVHLRTALVAYGHIFPPEAPPPTHEELLAQWERWLGPDHANRHRGFVAVGGAQGSAVVGMVLVGPDPTDPRVGHLARLYVVPERWGEGIGTRLYETALAALVGAGFTAATLWVLEHNARTRAWYERLGWRPSGARTATFEPGGVYDVGYRIDLPRSSPAFR